MSVSRAVLVTGCSSGIGRATALRLHAAGYSVYASARNAADITDLADRPGISTLPLDVTDEESMEAAVKLIADEHGAVGILINNAGYAELGTVEEVALDSVRRQFETNLIGPARLTQLVLPAMREQRYGRIINVSSVHGRFAVPGTGYYNASKHALEGLTDALRLEVAGFGVRVSIIEPGPVRTGFAHAALSSLPTPDGVPSGAAGSPYPGFDAKVNAWYAATYGDAGKSNLGGRLAVSADQVAGVITRAVGSRRPRARYRVGTLARMLIALHRFAPDPIFDAFVRTQFPVP